MPTSAVSSFPSREVFRSNKIILSFRAQSIRAEVVHRSRHHYLRRARTFARLAAAVDVVFQTSLAPGDEFGRSRWFFRLHSAAGCAGSPKRTASSSMVTLPLSPAVVGSSGHVIRRKNGRKIRAVQAVRQRIIFACPVSQCRFESPQVSFSAMKLNDTFTVSSRAERLRLRPHIPKLFRPDNRRSYSLGIRRSKMNM